MAETYETKKINELDTATSADDSDLMMVGDPGTGVTKNITKKNFLQEMQDTLDKNTSNITQNTNDINSLNSALAELDNTVSAKQNALSVQTISVDNITVAASDYNVVTADVSRSGYTALGIVGFMVSNASSSGTASSRCFPYECRLQSSTTARMYLRNTYTSDAKVAVYFYVLYAAN